MNLLVNILSAIGLLALAACSSSPPWSGRDVSDCSVSIRRTPCFGTCPVYEMTISGSGAVEFTGVNFVQFTGSHTAQIPVDSVRALIHQIETGGWFDLRGEYTDRSMSDAPTVHTTVTVGKRTKTVEHYAGDMSAPAILKVIDQRIDDIGGAARFIGLGMAPKEPKD